MNVSSLKKLHKEIKNLADAVEYESRDAFEQTASIDPSRTKDAINLLYYTALRRRDLRNLQWQLASYGLSSLGRCEGHVKASLNQLDKVLSAITDTKGLEKPLKAQVLVPKHQMLSSSSHGRHVQIMTTLGGKDAKREGLIADLFEAGTDLFRLNSGRDDAAVWRSLIAKIQQVEKQVGKAIPVVMDLSGPKLRLQSIKKQKGSPKIKLQLGFKDKKSPLSEVSLKEGSVFELKCQFDVGDLQKGHRVCFDDGLFQAVVSEVSARRLVCRVNQVSPEQKKLRIQKGCNLPDTSFTAKALTEKDKEVIEAFAPLVSYFSLSFCRHADDICDVNEVLKDKPNIGLIVKIETLQAVENLPSILLALMRFPKAAVMIARGDLATEISFERLSEIQEEILWYCEAARLPVIWATQVLENLSKFGLPSRSEVTDAAMSGRAECVMLNRGKHRLEAVRFLDDVLKRMQQHGQKKFPLLRPLGISENMNRTPTCPLKGAVL